MGFGHGVMRFGCDRVPVNDRPTDQLSDWMLCCRMGYGDEYVVFSYSSISLLPFDSFFLSFVCDI